MSSTAHPVFGHTCKNCSSSDILVTPGGITCDECGGHDLELLPQEEAVLSMDQKGQILELERMFALVNPQ
jgi:hypothetical protein